MGLAHHRFSVKSGCQASNGNIADRWEFFFLPCYYLRLYCSRADSRFAPCQWETSLQSNVVSHWLGATLESALLPLCRLHSRAYIGIKFDSVSKGCRHEMYRKFCYHILLKPPLVKCVLSWSTIAKHGKSCFLLSITRSFPYVIIRLDVYLDIEYTP